MLYLLEFSDFEFAEATAEASLHFIASLSSFSMGSRSWYDAPSESKMESEDRNLRECIPGTICSLLPAFSGAFVRLSGFIFSSSNTRSLLCRENARAS